MSCTAMNTTTTTTTATGRAHLRLPPWTPRAGQGRRPPRGPAHITHTESWTTSSGSKNGGGGEVAMRWGVRCRTDRDGIARACLHHHTCSSFILASSAPSSARISRTARWRASRWDRAAQRARARIGWWVESISINACNGHCIEVVIAQSQRTRIRMKYPPAACLCATCLAVSSSTSSLTIAACGGWEEARGDQGGGHMQGGL